MRLEKSCEHLKKIKNKKFLPLLALIILVFIIFIVRSVTPGLLIIPVVLSYIDLTDTTILSGLQKNVYPLYDELKELRGLKGVKEHLAYIRDKQDDYSKKNIAKYLKKSIEQYLPIVKRQGI